MTTFNIDGKTYDPNCLTDEQRQALSNLSFVKLLTNEKIAKNLILERYKSSLVNNLKETLGKNIIDIKIDETTSSIILENGTEQPINELEDDTKIQVQTLSNINSDLLELKNMLQVLDTARITYSKEFYRSLK